MSDKYYVYGIFEQINERINRCFYIGKGCGNRLNQHLKERNLKEENTFNISKTREINKIKITLYLHVKLYQG